MNIVRTCSRKISSYHLRNNFSTVLANTIKLTFVDREVLKNIKYLSIVLKIHLSDSLRYK